MKFLRFRPPITQRGVPAPHIRLDRALQFLIGDKLSMSDRRLRPRAFRLDDEKIAVDDAPAPFQPTAIVKSEASTFEPPPRAAARRGRARDRSGAGAILRRSRFSLAGLVLSGLGGLISLALGLWTSELIEELFARTAALGWIGVAFLAVTAVGLSC